MHSSHCGPQPATFTQVPVSQVTTPTTPVLMSQALSTQVPTTQTVTSNASHEASNDLVRTLSYYS